jgi:PEP-CTERM motif
VSPTSGSGTFDIQFTNPQNGNENGLSHIFLAGRFGTPPTLVPEPVTLALLGSGLLGLALARRRRG